MIDLYGIRKRNDSARDCYEFQLGLMRRELTDGQKVDFAVWRQQIVDVEALLAEIADWKQFTRERLEYQAELIRKIDERDAEIERLTAVNEKLYTRWKALRLAWQDTDEATPPDRK